MTYFLLLNQDQTRPTCQWVHRSRDLAISRTAGVEDRPIQPGDHGWGPSSALPVTCWPSFPLVWESRSAGRGVTGEQKTTHKRFCFGWTSSWLNKPLTVKRCHLQLPWGHGKVKRDWPEGRVEVMWFWQAANKGWQTFLKALAVHSPDAKFSVLSRRSEKSDLRVDPGWTGMD